MASVGVSQLNGFLLLLGVSPKASTLLNRERSASSESILRLCVSCCDSKSKSCNDSDCVESSFGRFRYSGLIGAKLSLHLMQHASSSDHGGILMVDYQSV